MFTVRIQSPWVIACYNQFSSIFQNTHHEDEIGLRVFQLAASRSKRFGGLKKCLKMFQVQKPEPIWMCFEVSAVRAAKAGGDVLLLLPDANETMEEVLKQVMRQGAKGSQAEPRVVGGFRFPPDVRKGYKVSPFNIW